MFTKLPDKIYIREYKLNGKSMFGDQYNINPSEETPNINNVEFIRKNVIIKLLCDRKDNMHILRTVYSKARRDEDAELIDIINSL